MAARPWNEEIARRIADLDSRKAKTVPWQQVRGKIQSRFTDGK
ncbi:MAG: hypothetical protein DMG43_10395 [Acidobacteria bacterium]|nr:MAG: hypothetical protein DMG43_10395 [Acidobacteriota bacterium]